MYEKLKPTRKYPFLVLKGSRDTLHNIAEKTNYEIEADCLEGRDDNCVTLHIPIQIAVVSVIIII